MRRTGRSGRRIGHFHIGLAAGLQTGSSPGIAYIQQPPMFRLLLGNQLQWPSWPFACC